MIPQFLFPPPSIHTIHTQDYQSVYLWRQSGAGGWFCRESSFAGAHLCAMIFVAAG
jgi:hypothetical protein